MEPDTRPVPLSAPPAPPPPLLHSSSSSSSWAPRRAGRRWRRSPKSRCCLRASGSINPACTAPGSGPKASPSRTFWAWSRTSRGGPSPAGPRARPWGARAPAWSRTRGASAGSRSRGARCRSAWASCAAWRRSSPPGGPASCRATCRCCRPGPTATTCTAWRPRGTPTPVRTGPHRFGLVRFSSV